MLPGLSRFPPLLEGATPPHVPSIKLFSIVAEVSEARLLPEGECVLSAIVT